MGLGMIYGKPLDAEGIEDRAYRLRHNEGQLRVDFLGQVIEQWPFAFHSDEILVQAFMMSWSFIFGLLRYQPPRLLHRGLLRPDNAPAYGVCAALDCKWVPDLLLTASSDVMIDSGHERLIFAGDPLNP